MSEFPVETDLGGDLQFLLPLRKIRWIKRTKSDNETRGDIEDMEFKRYTEQDMGRYEVFFWRMNAEEDSLMPGGLKHKAWWVLRTSCSLNPNLVGINHEDILVDEDAHRYIVKDTKKSCREFNMITLHCEEEE